MEDDPIVEAIKDPAFVHEVKQESLKSDIAKKAEMRQAESDRAVVENPLTPEFLDNLVKSAHAHAESSTPPPATRPVSPARGRGRPRSKSPKKSALRQSVDFAPQISSIRAPPPGASSDEKKQQAMAIRRYQRYKRAFMANPEIEWYQLSVEEMLTMTADQIYDEISAMRTVCSEINKHTMIDQALVAGAKTIEFASQKINHPLIDLGNTPASLHLSETVKEAYNSDDEFISIVEELRIIAESKVSSDPMTRLALKLSMLMVATNQENLQRKYAPKGSDAMYKATEDL